MDINPGRETVELLENLIYSDTQVSEMGVDLTVSKIYKVDDTGAIDFGGGEREDSNISEIEPEFKNPEDDYGWWELKPGTYLMEYNEKLTGEENLFLQPLERLIRNSATHPSKFVRKLELVPLHVRGDVIEIKENSRVSRILSFDE